MMYLSGHRFGALSASLLLATGLGSAAVTAENYVIFADRAFSNSFSQDVANAGGTLAAVYPFGIAVASSDDPAFATSLKGVQAVFEDTGFDVELAVAEVAGDVGIPPNSGDDDFFFDLQWGHNYVGAQQAWDAGFKGQGVRVAVLDTGFDLDHPDLAPNINLALSADFTGEGLQYTLPDTFSHGSHVSGTIAAADNGFGTIGVAPEAELVLVKVLSDTGSGTFANIVAGIYYAAQVDADVMNMSLGTIIPRTSDPVEVTQLFNAVNMAVNYAYRSGTTVIVSAGNAASDLDGNRDAVRFLTGTSNAIGISAATTLNWASDPDNAQLYPASYTNYGTSMVDFSAPGGSRDYPGNEGCIVAGRALPCWVFDLIFSTGNGGWFWSGGTSMAAPHATGVAALIISEHGSPMHPSLVEKELRNRSVDIGPNGRDDYFGHGVTNSGK